MNRFKAKLGRARKIFPVLFAFYLLAFLGILAPSHKHDLAKIPGHSHHEECQLCRVSSQPCVEASPIVVPEFIVTSTLLVETAGAQMVPAFCFVFNSRAPPSV